MGTLNNLVLIGAAICMLVVVQASSNPNMIFKEYLGSNILKKETNSVENLSESCPMYSKCTRKSTIMDKSGAKKEEPHTISASTVESSALEKRNNSMSSFIMRSRGVQIGMNIQIKRNMMDSLQSKSDFPFIRNLKDNNSYGYFFYPQKNRIDIFTLVYTVKCRGNAQKYGAIQSFLNISSKHQQQRKTSKKLFLQEKHAISLLAKVFKSV